MLSLCFGVLSTILTTTKLLFYHNTNMIIIKNKKYLWVSYRIYYSLKHIKRISLRNEVFIFFVHGIQNSLYISLQSYFSFMVCKVYQNLNGTQFVKYLPAITCT